jgi:hypothetical protein
MSIQTNGPIWSQTGDEALMGLETFRRNGGWPLLFAHSNRPFQKLICAPGAAGGSVEPSGGYPPPTRFRISAAVPQAASPTGSAQQAEQFQQCGNCFWQPAYAARATPTWMVKCDERTPRIRFTLEEPAAP